MSTCQETGELPLALFERFKQSDFYLATAQRIKGGTEKDYEDFVRSLADEAAAISRNIHLKLGFNCVLIPDQEEDNQINHVDIILIDGGRNVKGLVQICPTENPLPEDLEEVFTLLVYVDPRFRCKGLSKKLLLQAHEVVNELSLKTGKPTALFEYLSIPNTPAYQSLRKKMSGMLTSVGYHSLDQEAGFFMKLVN
ncbi:MAG TPA: hypothetical protein VMW29_02995 [Candidatus Bathyarchaeia archaeon]|nr:hypothetical protein [Candidatus Bathyarchaeia archaeon]